MKEKLHDEQMKILFQGIASLQSLEECARFFDDLCTATELCALSQRFHVAQMLYERCIYNEIAEKTGASTATISRVNRSMQYGSEGYQMVLERIKS